MILRLKNLTTTAFLFCAIIFAVAENIKAQPKEPEKIANLRKLFKAATDNDFELVRDEVRGNDSSHTGGRYWLAHVKPKQSGFYSLKYTYKNVGSPNNYPEEGEHQLGINVGGKICYRYNNIDSGIGSYCLGDTIILPIRLDGVSEHSFNLERRLQNGESLQEAQKRQKSFVRFSEIKQVGNPLVANLKLLGTQRSSSPYRSCCRERVTHYAYFEAVSPGRFNLSVSSLRADERLDALTKPESGGIPIIIVNPGTPITALLSGERTINYADNKRFSAHAGNSFMTNVLILQPGDVFTIQYSEYTIGDTIGAKLPKRPEPLDLKPVIYKLPFEIDKNWGFNEWIVNYFPFGK